MTLPTPTERRPDESRAEPLAESRAESRAEPLAESRAESRAEPRGVAALLAVDTTRLTAPPNTTQHQIDWVLFDADDTLWHSEGGFQNVQRHVETLLKPFVNDPSHLEAQLAETERRNIPLFGYGVKGFTLSMIESAIQLSNGQITADAIHAILMQGRTLLDKPVDVLPNVEEVLRETARHYRLGVVTKGDLLDQSNKLRDSRLESFFSMLEVVTEKNAPTYDALFRRHNIHPNRTVMIGNSIPSDCLPPLSLGSFALHIPYGETAAFEQHDGNVTESRFLALTQIADVPAVLRWIEDKKPLRELVTLTNP